MYNGEINMADEMEISYEEEDDQIPNEEIEWTHAVLNDFEMTIDALGIETVMFLMSKYHEDIIKAWIKNGVDIQNRRKQ